MDILRVRNEMFFFINQDHIRIQAFFTYYLNHFGNLKEIQSYIFTSSFFDLFHPFSCQLVLLHYHASQL